MLSQLLLQDSPWNVALIDIFIRARECCFGSFFRRIFSDPLILGVSIEVDILLLDQIAIPLVVTVAATRYDWHLGHSQVVVYLLVVYKDFHGVRQYLRQINIADLSNVNHFLVSLKLPKGRQ